MVTWPVTSRTWKVKVIAAIYFEVWRRAQRPSLRFRTMYETSNRPVRCRTSSLDCLKGNVTNRHGTFLDVYGKVLDGPAKVHFMVPGSCRTFEDYVNHMWWRNWTLSLESILHVMFTSLTAWKMQRQRREAVALVVGFHPPGNCQRFLRDKENKQELFRFFAEKCDCGPNVRPHQWTSNCRCSTAVSLLQEV